MQAVVINNGRLAPAEVPRPVIAPSQVLVRVHATAVNRADLLQVAGRYPVPPGAPAEIPGLEFAGEIAEVGGEVRGWRSGDRVMGIAGGGTYAELVAVHAGALAAVPDAIDFATAGAIPEAFITAHDSLISQAVLREGESVLIHAVGSGVGLAAVQVAAWCGAVAYGTTRTAAKLEAARKVGLRDGVVAGDDLDVIPEAVRTWCGHSGVSVVLDLVGGPYLAADLESLGILGRLVLVGTVAGNRAELRLDRVLRKRLRIMGTVLRGRTDAEKSVATAAFVRDLLPAFESGTMRPVVHVTLPLDMAAEAHRIVASDENIGKVVLAVA